MIFESSGEPGSLRFPCVPLGVLYFYNEHAGLSQSGGNNPAPTPPPQVLFAVSFVALNSRPFFSPSII
jgi:hypothetical protein